MDLESWLLVVVFALFGLEVLVRVSAWLFAQWRTFQDMKDAHEAEPETPASSTT